MEIERKEIEYKYRIIHNYTQESFLPCVICLTPTRHRHIPRQVGLNWGGSQAPVCESCCKGVTGPKKASPSIRDWRMNKRMRCTKCGYMGPELRFKRWKSSNWLNCPNCGIKKNKDAKDRHKIFEKIWTLPRESIRKLEGE